MKNIEPWKAWTFSATLLVIAAVISSISDYFRVSLTQSLAPFSQSQQQETSRTPSEPAVEQATTFRPVQPAVERTLRGPVVREKTPEELAAEHARYLARYLNTKFVRNAAVETVAVVVGTQDRKLNSSLANALGRRFSSEKVKAVSTIFTPEFVSDGLFDDTFGGSRTVLSNLELKTSLDALLLARQTVQYSTTASLEDVITANMGLEVLALSLSTTAENQTWSFSTSGAGFTQRDARALAEERLLKQIANDTKMSLNPVLRSK